MTEPAPPMHPQARERLEAILASGEPPLETLEAAEARRIADERVIATAGPGPDVGSVEERRIDGLGRPIALRLYRPAAAREPPPIVLYLHGGGFVVGNLDTVDTICRELTEALGCLTVSVDYRLGPEHRFPAAVEDCLAAARFVAGAAAGLGGDPGRMAIVGESSGGSLAAAVSALGAADGTVRPLRQVMIYPALDLTRASEGYRRNGEGYFLTRSKMRWFVDHYLGRPEDARDPRASPLLAASFAGLPPTLVIAASLDPLVDEAEAYADRLRAAGVPTIYHCAEGWPHGFVYWAGSEARAETMALVLATLQSDFARPDAGA